MRIKRERTSQPHVTWLELKPGDVFSPVSNPDYVCLKTLTGGIRLDPKSRFDDTLTFQDYFARFNQYVVLDAELVIRNRGDK